MGQILQIGLTSDTLQIGPQWINKQKSTVRSNDSSLTVTTTTSTDESNSIDFTAYDLSIKSVSTDTLTQGTNVLILDGGSAE